MNELFKQGEVLHDKAWFRERACSGVNRINDTEWDYSDSLLLYLPGHDEAYEAVQEGANPYHEMVTAPERKYLAEIASRIAEILPSDFDYFDLGPGTEHKEQFLFDALSKDGKSFDYSPVDISERYLDLSVKHAQQQGINAHPIRSSFEDLPDAVVGSTKNRFVSLGLTYSNYNPEEILQLLKKIRGENGNIFINSQIRDRIDIERLRSIYQEVAVDMCLPKLELLGLNPAADLSDVEVTNDVKIWYKVKNVNSKLEEIGVKTGDRILVFQSLRPTLDDLDKMISTEFDDYELLDTGDSFVGVITK